MKEKKLIQKIRGLVSEGVNMAKNTLKKTEKKSDKRPVKKVVKKVNKKVASKVHIQEKVSRPPQKKAMATRPPLKKNLVKKVEAKKPIPSKVEEREREKDKESEAKKVMKKKVLMRPSLPAPATKPTLLPSQKKQEVSNKLKKVTPNKAPVAKEVKKVDLKKSAESEKDSMVSKTAKAERGEGRSSKSSETHPEEKLSHSRDKDKEFERKKMLRDDFEDDGHDHDLLDEQDDEDFSKLDDMQGEKTADSKNKDKGASKYSEKKRDFTYDPIEDSDDFEVEDLEKDDHEKDLDDDSLSLDEEEDGESSDIVLSAVFDAEADLLSKAKELGEKIIEEVTALTEDYNIADIREAIKGIDFFNNNDTDECLEKFCENLQTTLGYCRFHYIRNWKTLRKKRAILAEGKLQQFIEELIHKYPPKYIEIIMNDLSGDKQFFKILKDLNIDTIFQYEEGSSDIESDDDITVETRGFTATRANYDDEDIL